jgi:hypothetical protein
MATILSTVTAEKVAIEPAQSFLCLNGFELIDASSLHWPVQVLEITLKDVGQQTHADLGKLRSIVWDLRKTHKCRGHRFVVDAGESAIALPAECKLPLPIETPEFSVRLKRELVADSSTAVGRRIVARIVKEAIKARFKKDQSPALGPLWQDFDGFAQSPSRSSDGFLMCRKLWFQINEVAEGRLILQCNVGTLTVDNRTFQEHYGAGAVSELCDMIEAKRAGRANRDNRPVAIRALQQFPGGGVRAVEVLDVDAIFQDSDLNQAHQVAAAQVRQLRCTEFAKPPAHVPLSELRLILDSQITGDEHRETILEPTERADWMFKMREFIDGVDAFGCTLHLASLPYAPPADTVIEIVPPAIRLRGANGREIIMPAPERFDQGLLRKRARSRADHIRRNGFLQSRPINPALAFPRHLGERRASRMKQDLEGIWKLQGIEAAFGLCLYNTVEEIYRFIEANNHDTLLAVLPENSQSSQGDGETHDRLKRRIEVPSQCIQHGNTLPSRFLGLGSADFMRTEPRRAKRVTNTYELCLANLLVKHHCFPFAPRDPFHYNLQVGLDVGGVHNSAVMACLGYGFSSPRDGIILLPGEIPISGVKKEPIPTDQLYNGLIALFERVHSELENLSVTPDLSTAIFYKDGQLLGDGDSWNERDALDRLHRELVHRGWITEDSTWTAVEVMKRGHGWRLLGNSRAEVNPIVGQCSFPFEDPSWALVATTGDPYLTQGTAQPLLIRMHDIHGGFNRCSVVRDLVWQADLCFTKVDMGMSLPWVLNVADEGALQLARAYYITGITA